MTIWKLIAVGMLPLFVGREVSVQSCTCGAPQSLVGGSAPGGVMPEMTRYLHLAEAATESDNPVAGVSYTDLVLLAHPLAVYIEPGAGRQTFESALRKWQSLLNDAIEFTVVDKITEADITVHWREDLTLGSQPIGGYATWRRGVVEARPQFSATIQIRTTQPNGRRMTDSQLFHVACHELGHILGLADAAKLGRVMGPLDLRSPVKGPSHEEIAQLIDLREEALEVRRRALMRYCTLNDLTP